MKNLLHRMYLPHFQKDAQGKDIYYPWGYAGDCWYINRTQKIILRISYIIAFFILCISALSFGLLTSNYSDEGIVITTFNAVIFAWVIFFYFFSKKLEEVKQPATSIRKPDLPKALTIGFAVMMAFITVGYLKSPTDPLLKISGLCVVVAYPLLIWFVHHRRGYLFQKIPPTSNG